MPRRDEVLRAYVRQLTALGLTQKAIATAVERNEGWVTKFLKNESGPITHEMARGLYAHLRRLAALLNDIEAYRLRPPEEDVSAAADVGAKPAKAKRASSHRKTG